MIASTLLSPLAVVNTAAADMPATSDSVDPIEEQTEAPVVTIIGGRVCNPQGRAGSLVLEVTDPDTAEDDGDLTVAVRSSSRRIATLRLSSQSSLGAGRTR